MTIVECPRTGEHAIGVYERINLSDFFGIDNFHAETDVVGDTLQETKPIKVVFGKGETNAACSMPAYILSGKFLQFWVQPVAVVVNFGQVVVAYQAWTLSGCMPGGT